MTGTPEREPRTGDSVDAVLLEAQRQIRAPWAASLAGVLFSVLFTVALLFLRGSLPANPTDQQVVDWFASGEDTRVIIGGLYLAPFAGIAFLWFIAVIRDQIGEREDKFFATVFFGSGLLFVALLFIASAVATSIVLGVNLLGQAIPSAQSVDVLRSLSYAILYAFGTRAAALFLLSTATIVRRTGVFPRWVTYLGYAIGLVLLLFVSIWDYLILVLPVWVFLLSLFILVRERARRGLTGAPPAGG